MDAIKPASDGELLKVLTRLMTPFRREFQQFLDVNRLLIDQGYAKEVLDKLQQSEHPNIVSARLFLADRMKIDLPATPIAVAEVNPYANAGAPPEVAAQPTPEQPVPLTKYVKRLR